MEGRAHGNASMSRLPGDTVRRRSCDGLPVSHVRSALALRGMPAMPQVWIRRRPGSRLVVSALRRRAGSGMAARRYTGDALAYISRRDCGVFGDLRRRMSRSCSPVGRSTLVRNRHWRPLDSRQRLHRSVPSSRLRHCLLGGLRLRPHSSSSGTEGSGSHVCWSHHGSGNLLPHCLDHGCGFTWRLTLMS